MTAPAVPPGVTVIGAGNWGISLVHAVLAARIPLREIVVRRIPRAKPRGLEAIPFVLASGAELTAAVLWICVPDSRIAVTAEELAALRPGLRGQIVVHSSGALSVDQLSAAAKAGAGVGSIHPVMSFPTRDPVPLEGVLFGVEAEPAVRRKLFKLVRKLGGKPFAIPSKNKALYHAATTLASPLLVSALSTALAAARKAGLSTREAKSLIEPLAQATVRNFFERGAEKSFSGPFARGDAPTIDLHLRALARHPILAGVYRALARQAVSSLPVREPENLSRVIEAAGETSNSRRR